MEADLNIEAIKEMLEAARAERRAKSAESVESPALSMDSALNELNALIAHPYEEEVRGHLQYLRQTSEANPMGWKALHGRLTRHWPDDPARNRVYAHLVSWSAACLMHTEATRALKRTLTPNVRGGRLADLSFSSRWIPTAERQLVSTALLWPDIREKIMSLRVKKDAR